VGARFNFQLDHFVPLGNFGKLRERLGMLRERLGMLRELPKPASLAVGLSLPKAPVQFLDGGPISSITLDIYGLGFTCLLLNQGKEDLLLCIYRCSVTH